MPTVIYETIEIQLSDGTNIKVKPLTITHLKKFLSVVKKLQDNSVETEEQAMEIFIEAGMICMEQFAPGLATDKAKFEDTIEIPTLMKILEVAGGLKLNADDPNFPGANLAGNL
jgi:esterase/lipase